MYKKFVNICGTPIRQITESFLTRGKFIPRENQKKNVHHTQSNACLLKFKNASCPHLWEFNHNIQNRKISDLKFVIEHAYMMQS